MLQHGFTSGLATTRLASGQACIRPLQALHRRQVVINAFRRTATTTRQPVQTEQPAPGAPTNQPAAAAASGKSGGRGLKHLQTAKPGRGMFAASRSVKFHVRYKCEYGQEVYLVGNCGALGDWDVMKGKQLVWSAGHIWEGSVELPAGMHIQYKYVVRSKDGSVVRWQEGANVSLELPGGTAAEVALDVEDSWNKSKQVKRILASGTPVRFNIRVKTEFGQHLVVVGSCAMLGGWNVDQGLRLTWQEGNVWEAGADMPAGELVEYKYVIVNADGTVEKWQPSDNMVMEVPAAQGNTGRRRGVLVLDTWSKPNSSSKRAAGARSSRARGPAAAGSWRSTPYSSVPANGSSPTASADISDASSAMAARSYYSMMSPPGSSSGSSSSSSVAVPAAGISDPVPSHLPDPDVMQLWTDKPRFAGSSSPRHQAHQDPWAQQQQQEEQPQQPRVFVPPPPAGSGTEEYARWQALQSVMAALQHSSELDHWADDPTDPRMLAADRRLAALTASLGSSTGTATAAAVV